MKTLRSDGFAALEAILVVVVLVVLGGAGYEIVKIREHIKRLNKQLRQRQIPQLHQPVTPRRQPNPLVLPFRLLRK